MAIEDVGALGMLFSDAGHDDLSVRLQLFEDLRKDRASATQIPSNTGQDESTNLDAKLQSYLKGVLPRQYIINEYSTSNGANTRYRDLARDTGLQLRLRCHISKYRRSVQH